LSGGWAKQAEADSGEAEESKPEAREKHSEKCRHLPSVTIRVVLDLCYGSC
jgi:hypothetical protein